MLLPGGGNVWRGTAEKIYEQSSTGNHEYVGKDRTRATVEVFVERRVFDRHEIIAHIVEEGPGREFTSYHRLELQPTGKMIGTFLSTAGDQEGRAKWQQQPF